MPNYTQIDNTQVIGSTYLAETLTGEDYVAFAVDSNHTVAIQGGNLSINDDGTGSADNADVCHIYRQQGQGYGYRVEWERGQDVTFAVVNPYYVHGSFDTLPSWVLTKVETAQYRTGIIVNVLIILLAAVYPIIKFCRTRWA